MKTPDPQIVSLSREQLLAWQDRMQERLLPDAAGDFAILQALLAAYLFVVAALSATRVSLVRLKRLFGIAPSEKSRKILPKPSGEDREDESASGGAGHPPKNGGGRRKGHGRNGVAAYPEAERIPVRHETFVPGFPCPHQGCKGKVYRLKEPGVVLRIIGQPALIGKIWEQERWRCNLCEDLFYATLPAEAIGPTFDVTAVAMIAVLHFANGFAFKRLEQHQASLRTPVPASDQSEALSNAYAKLRPVLKELIRQAAQYDILHNDDTGMRILALLAVIRNSASKNPKGRTGIHTTAIVAVSLTLNRHIVLYFTGSKHAGENLAKVLEQRQPELPPAIHQSDGLDHNKPGKIRVIEAKCLTHGRRQFVDVMGSFPEQCQRVVEDLALVYRTDALAREKKLTPEERLWLHQEKGGPIMEKLHRWLTDQLLEKSVEPNSGLGKAIKYMLKRWDRLTLFLSKAGAPLDNNIAERALKKAIRHRKNSLFFKTKNGAAVGDLFMSLIETCALNQVNAFDYLTALLRNAHRLEESPGSWMPWNYQAMLHEEVTSATAPGATPEPPAAGSVPAGSHPAACETAPAPACAG